MSNFRIILLLLLLLSPFETFSQPEPFLLETMPMPQGRAYHGAAVLGDFLYTFGGSAIAPGGEKLPAAFVHVAKTTPQGGIAAWAQTQPIPQPRLYIDNSSIVMNDTVYIIGGSDAVLGGNRANTILWNRPFLSGHLDQWRESPPFGGVGVSCAAAFTTPGYLHLTGGTGQGDMVSQEVWSMKLNPDGSPGRWEKAPPLPAPLWFHCAAVVGARAYIWGGLNQDEPGYTTGSTKIYSAPVLGSGRLGQWRQESVELPKGFYSAVTAVAGPYLFSICPRYEYGEESGDIWWTFVTPEGMRPWQLQQTAITTKVYRAVATDYRRGVIYLTGGMDDSGDDPKPTTFRIKLSENARKLAEEAWLERQSVAGNSISSADFANAQSTHGNRVSFWTEEGTPQKSALDGFLPLDEARAASTQNQQPLVMYFNADTAGPCKEQESHLVTKEFQSIHDKAVFATIDVTRYPQLTQQYGVFRVPTWIIYDPGGNEQGRLVGVVKPEELFPKLTAMN